jgi:hypothetical protein
MADMPVLTLRTLNRTLLTRQLLVTRTALPALAVVEHLIAMQAQEPNWPYIGLWTRSTDFRHDDLTALIEDRSVARTTLLRATQHLTSRDDFRWLRPTIQPVLDGTMRHAYFTRETAGLDHAAVIAAGRELLADRTLVRKELGALLAERFPGRDSTVLAGLLQYGVALVHPPPNGNWGKWGTRSSTPVTLAEAWFGGPTAELGDVETMIRRYLAAFGPASVMDVQAWSGMTRLREVVDGLRAELRVVHDEHGRELFDLPDAPLVDGDLPVPVRFLPAYDNLLLGHADRRRVLADEDRKPVFPGQARVRPTFLVDGFVEGVWTVKGSTLLVSPLRPLSKAAAASVVDEAEHLLAFVAPNPDEWDIAFT